MESDGITVRGKSFGDLWRASGETLRGSWGNAVLTTVIFTAINTAAGMIFKNNGCVNILLSPLTFGIMLFFLTLARRKPVNTGLLFEPFGQYFRYLWGGLRQIIFVFLWSLLFIVPGIIALYRYALTEYIMLDHPEMSAKAAMAYSGKLMYGHKGRLFGYSLLFGIIGIPVLSLTLGLGLLWYLPWCNAFLANFYLELHDKVPEAPAPETGNAL